MKRFVGENVLINCDDLPFIEFNVPLAEHGPEVLFVGNVIATSEMKQSIVPRLTNTGATPAERHRVVERMQSYERARGLVVRSIVANETGDSDGALRMCREAAEINPDDREAADFLASHQEYVESQRRRSEGKSREPR